MYVDTLSLIHIYEQITQLDGTPVTTTGGTYAKLMPHIVPVSYTHLDVYKRQQYLWQL